MNTKKYTWIFYLITVTIITTIAVQFYWNYKNYEENKIRISNEIQLSLDNAIEEYYAKLAKEEFTTIINFSSQNEGLEKNIKFDSVFNNSKKFKDIKSIIEKNTSKENIKKYKITNIPLSSNNKLNIRRRDSIFKKFTAGIDPKDIKSINVFNEPRNHNELQQNIDKDARASIKLLNNLKPIFLSITTSSINYKKLDSLVINQLKQKEIPIEYAFHHYKKDTIYYASKDSLVSKKFIKNVSSKSTYLKKDEAFKLLFNNSNYIALQRSFGGISLSLLLSLLIISSLFYLLKVINQQKELAAIKNDLISNITHEFKTPIATVSTAIEAIENFNVLDDKEKTQKYLAMSSLQLKKLHQMVEKLLETATLDSESLLLKKEPTDLVFLIEKLAIKHQMLTTSKTIKFSSNVKNLVADVDVFHFENSISNLIDNAVKYGGDLIEVSINSVLNSVEISVADNGNGIEKNQQEKIFDKFYRVPKGNTHDVKGFGIGLYYTKKIIEKHNGTIEVSANSKKTIFKIILPNE